jgi:drug/metabolite transporter (DMT)-like permease
LGFALVASLALVLAHVRKDHFVFDKYSVAALFSSLFFGFEFVVSRPLLEFYSPFTFYFVRSLVIFLIGWTFFHPKFVPLKNETKWLFLIAGAGAVVYRVILYYGYLTLGVIYTTTVFIMAPVLVYIFAAMFLKEKITKRQIVSSLVIVACVVGAMWVGS